MIESLFERILLINHSGVSVVLIEQNAHEALKISHRGYVLAAGNNQLDGNGNELLENSEVARLYLGG
jgi:branched-chain amino acid transport system ATP-binding protein/neutral amino acid transport system ATP-binding protein